VLKIRFFCSEFVLEEVTPSYCCNGTILSTRTA